MPVADAPHATREGLRLALGARRVSSDGEGIGDLQSLLLQISFAIMMVFMMAYFLFRNRTIEETETQILEMQRQKLVAAVETVAADYGARYGLPVLAARGADGDARYHPEDCIVDGRLTEVPTLRRAFCSGASNARADYDDALALRREWLSRILAGAELDEHALKDENREWLGGEVDSRIAGLREEVRNVQLLSAALLQEHWAAHPELIDDPKLSRLLDAFQKAGEEERLRLASDVAAILRRHCLEYLSREAGADML